MYVLLYFKVYFHANILKPSGVPALFFLQLDCIHFMMHTVLLYFFECLCTSYFNGKSNYNLMFNNSV